MRVCESFFYAHYLMMEGRIKRINNVYMRCRFAVTLGALILLFPPLYGEGYGSLTALLNNNVEGAADSLFTVR